MQIIVIKTQGNVTIKSIKVESDNVLEEFAKILKCDTCERVKVKNEKFKDFTIWCDEEGLMKKEPIINPIASYYYGIQEHGQPIVGDIIIAAEKRTNDGVEITGLTENDCRTIINNLYEDKEEIIKTMVNSMGNHPDPDSPREGN